MEGLRQNISKNLSSTPDGIIKEVETKCPAFTDQFKRLFFVISFYHAVMTERKRFKALGWNKIYEFSQVDYQISHYTAISIFKELDKQNEMTIEIPEACNNFNNEELYSWLL